MNSSTKGVIIGEIEARLNDDDAIDASGIK